MQEGLTELIKCWIVSTQKESQNMPTGKPDSFEIDRMIKIATETEAENQHGYFYDDPETLEEITSAYSDGLTVGFAQGVQEALRWVKGEHDVEPFT